MHTLIELYDERAIENVIGPETFRPEHVIYLCPQEIARDPAPLKTLNSFFRKRGLDTTLEFVESSIFKSDKILAQLRKIAQEQMKELHMTEEEYAQQEENALAIDVTGGTDAALFAAGMFCREFNVPAFTYSRKRNQFYDINRAPYADNKPCDLQYSVEDFFLMAGGTMRKGRVDNSLLGKYMDLYDPFFQVFLKHRSRWVDAITFMQRISQCDPTAYIPLYVKGSYEQKGDRGGKIYANQVFFRDLERIGFIRDLEIVEEESVAFAFKDLQVRNWLRDVGSVLELYTYKACVDAGIFQDVISSAIVDWDGTVSRDSVSNEIDVVATRGVVPIFISCKATEIKTSSLNELAILRDRFGGKGAKAAIVTTERCNAAERHRAAQLGIAVIDREEVEQGKIADRIKVIMKVISGDEVEV